MTPAEQDERKKYKRKHTRGNNISNQISIKRKTDVE